MNGKFKEDYQQNVALTAEVFPLLISFSSSQAHSTFVIPSPYSLHVQLGHQTWSLSSLLRPPIQSRLRITNRSFRHTAPQLWNKLPRSLRVPYQSGSSLSSPLSSGSNPEPAVNLSHGMFHSRLKTSFQNLFLLSSLLSHGLITW